MSPKFCLECGSPLALTVLEENVARLKCTKADCSFVFYNNPIPVVAALVEHSGEIVLVRNVGWPANWFGLVTGFLEHKEDPAVGVLREVKEELGLEADIVSLIGVYNFAQMNQVLIAYHVRARGNIRIDPREIAAYKTVMPHRLVPWPGGTGLAVRDWLLTRNRKASNL